MLAAIREIERNDSVARRVRHGVAADRPVRSVRPMTAFLGATPHPASQSQGLQLDPVYIAIFMALLVWVVVYLLYKVMMTQRKDFGMPVRRRILCKRLRVDHDQYAEVPFWWTDLQVQLAVRNHWRNTLRGPQSGQSEQHRPV
jgi:hypothetical protein